MIWTAADKKESCFILGEKEERNTIYQASFGFLTPLLILLSQSADFSKSNFFKKFFQEYY